MAKIVRLFFLMSVVGLGFARIAHAQESEVVPGLVTANNVDITTDTGEIMDQRLNVGDPVYIVTKPKQKRDGWIRISKSPGDTAGYGWIEAKNARGIRRWEKPVEEIAPSPAEKTGEKTVFAPDVEPSGYGQVGVLPFISPEADDPVAKWAYDAFSTSLKNNKKFQVQTDSVKSEVVDPDAPATVQAILTKNHLDGVFVGNLSGEMGNGRLLQIKFFGKGREGAVLEKVKKLPKEGNLKEVIDGLVASCVSTLQSK